MTQTLTYKKDNIKQTNKPVGFELSSYMHMYHAFANHIYSFSSKTTYVFLAWQTYFHFLFLPITIEIIHTGAPMQIQMLIKCEVKA